MKKNNKLLTIGIPNYNGGEYLKDTILSCKNIELEEHEYEILVVDNGSTDNSIDIVKNLQNNFKNLKLILNEKNYGRVGNWNRIIELAESDTLLFQMVGDVLNKINIKEDIHYILKGNHVNYSYMEKINGKIIKHNSGKEIKEGNMYYNPCNISRSKDFFVGYLQNTILALDIIRKQNIIFDEKIEYFSDAKFFYDYFIHIKKFRNSNQYIFTKNNDKNRATFFLSHKSCDEYIYLYKYIGIRKNKFKYYSYILSIFMLMYIKSFALRNKKIRFKMIISFIKKHKYNTKEIGFSLILMPLSFIYYIFGYKVLNIYIFKKIINWLDK